MYLGSNLKKKKNIEAQKKLWYPCKKEGRGVYLNRTEFMSLSKCFFARTVPHLEIYLEPVI